MFNLVLLAGLTTLISPPQSTSIDVAAPIELPRESVVKVFAKVRYPDISRPWTKQSTQESTGSGVILDNNIIITNAHVVNYATRLHVQPYGADERFEVEVAFVSYLDDLAILTPKDDDFFASFPGTSLDSTIPLPGTSVTVIGFPKGGNELSTTEGIVSRVEYMRQSGFRGLSIQVDAPINSGNSGGPAFVGNNVAGIAFQKSAASDSDSIGYVIPAETVVRFIDDCADGTFNDLPRLPLRWSKAENPQLRKRVGMKKEQSGVILAPRSGWTEAETAVQKWDVLTEVNGYAVDNFGKIELENGLKLEWIYALAKAQNISEGLSCVLLREGVKINHKLLLYDKSTLPRLFANDKGKYPSYYIYGPMVLIEASDLLIDNIGGGTTAMFTGLGHPLAARMSQRPLQDGERIILVSGKLLDHSISKGYEQMMLPVIDLVNGRHPLNLRELVGWLENNEDQQVVFEFDANNLADPMHSRRPGVQDMVFDHADVLDAREEMLEEAAIRRHYSKDFESLISED